MALELQPISFAEAAAFVARHHRHVTYTLATEPGSSLLGAGWKSMYMTRAKSWNMPGRPRVDTTPPAQRTLWEAQ